MIELTTAQVRAAASLERLVNIVSAPGSGKTTVAAERFGWRRQTARGDKRGVLGLSFTEAASVELSSRVKARWGHGTLTFPHDVITFDELHVRLLHALLRGGKIRWPNGHSSVHVVNSYQGYEGYRYLTTANWKRAASLNSRYEIVSAGVRVAKPGSGIGNVDSHRAVLDAGIASHEDVRNILLKALEYKDLEELSKAWLGRNYREVIVDEVYDADPLDLGIVALAASAGMGVTMIGDPRQALYGWRGATPDKVELILSGSPFTTYEQPQSFRFSGPQMPALARQLRSGEPVTLPEIDSAEIDVALARRWQGLWTAGDNVLPIAFRSIQNGTDAMLNLLLDVATRSRLGRGSFGRDTALVQLGLTADDIRDRQEAVLAPILDSLMNGTELADVLAALRQSAASLGSKKNLKKLSEDKEQERLHELSALRDRLRLERVVPGLTVHQAKGCEWRRVGVVLTAPQVATLAAGLRELVEEDCIIYVALTRAMERCGRLQRKPEPLRH